MAAKAKPVREEPDSKARPDEDVEEGASPPKRQLPLKLILLASGAGGAADWRCRHRLCDFRSQQGNAGRRGAGQGTHFPRCAGSAGESRRGTERSQYLKIKIVLDLPDAALTPQMQAAMPRLMDAFQTYLRELRATDLDGSAGLYRLKEELTRRVNASISPGRINAVLFKEIVVQ